MSIENIKAQLEILRNDVENWGEKEIAHFHNFLLNLENEVEALLPISGNAHANLPLTDSEQPDSI